MRRLMSRAGTLLLALLFCSSTVVLPTEKNETDDAGAYATTITWMTDKPSTSQVEIGKEFEDYTQSTPEDVTLTLYHKVVIDGLKPSSTYNYRVISRDAYGNREVSRNLVLVTRATPPQNTPPEISDIEASTIWAAGPASSANPSGANTSNENTSKTADQLIKKETPLEKALIERGGILLRKRRWQIESSTTYVHTSANSITVSGYTILPVLVVGEISTQKVKRDILIQMVTARYGLRNNLQWELNVPYRYQFERVSVDAPPSESTRHYAGLGDISSGLSYQLAYESGLMPDVIVGLSVKPPTGASPYNRSIGLGTGHWGIRTSMVAVKSSDPAILFGSLGYTYNVQRNNIDNYGDIKPGDSIDYGLGVAFALNYNIALSFQLQQSITQKMRMNSSSIPGSFTNVVNFKYGLTWSINKSMSCEVSASHGLTADSPGFVIELSFPITF